MNQRSPKFFLGVDGGNTKTIALISSAEGDVVGAGRGGCADIYGSADVALASIEVAIARALAAAKREAPDIAAAAFSLAGADWPEDFVFLERSLKRCAPRITVFNDAIGAIIAGAPEGWGASVVCGTGGTAGARSAEGKTWHGGFWHDSSCGADTLGQAAIAAVLRAELKMDPATRLTDLLLAHYGKASVEEMLHGHTRRLDRLPRLAAGLARLLLDAAAEGDLTAGAIVQAQAASAARYVIVAAREVGILEQPFPLVLAGGVLRHPSKLLEETLLEHVHQRAPQAEAIRTDIEPVAGALLAAIQLGGQTMTRDLRRRLHETHPPQALFETR